MQTTGATEATSNGTTPPPPLLCRMPAGAEAQGNGRVAEIRFSRIPVPIIQVLPDTQPAVLFRTSGFSAIGTGESARTTSRANLR